MRSKPRSSSLKTKLLDEHGTKHPTLGVIAPPAVPAKLPPEKFKQLMKEATHIQDQLPEAQRQALSHFTGSSYRAMRAIQAGDFGHSSLKHFSSQEIEAWKKNVKELEEGQKALQIDNPTKHGVLHRGFNVNQDDLHAMLTGDAITHDGFSTNSTSYSRSVSESFLSKEHKTSAYYGDDKDGDMKYPVMLVYTKVKSGANLMYEANGSHHEQEIALGRGTFKITQKRFVQAAGSIDAKRYFEFTVEQVDD